VSTESLVLHGERNHFSMWLKARSEFELADRLRPRRVSDYESAEHLRDDLLRAIGAYRLARDRAVVADFDRDSYDESVGMARIGTGSLGGKARGLAFVNRLLLDAEVAGHFPDVQIAVPPSVVLGTGVFDEFLEKNRLADLALGATPEEELRRRFAEAPLPRGVERDLKAFLRRTPGPLAVRSSGLLEDSPSQPLAGVYRTIMLPNRGRLRQRLADLLEAVKAVSDLFAPVSGEVVEINKDIQSTPDAINKDPYGKGWMIKMRIGNAGDLDVLLDVEAYKKLVAK